MSDALLRAICKAWQEAVGSAPGNRRWRAVRVPSTGPLSVYGGIREEDGALALLFETAIENAPTARARFEAGGISMLEERDFTNRVFRISVTLERRDLHNIFSILSTDLIEAAENRNSPGSGVEALFLRLETWQAFLRARHGGLGRESVIGLIGELTVLGLLACEVGWGTAVDSWKGPAGGLHDFARMGRSIEVKSGTGTGSTIEITSLDQMDDTGVETLLLAHVRLIESVPGDTLPSMEARILNDMEQNAPEAVRPFRDSLLASGYVQSDADLYLQWSFVVAGTDFYCITPEFPRITRRNVMQGIIEARYRIDIGSIQEFRVDDSFAPNVMGEMGDAT